SSPALARQLAAAATAKGCLPLDAPVSGGDRGAREGTMTIMVGGEAAAFEQARPLFEAMGKTISLQGGPGAGQLCKLANQIAIASGMVAMAEALAFARANQLDLEAVLKALSGGGASSWALLNLAPRVLKGDFAPGFYVKHFVKDIGLSLEVCRELKLSLPGLELAAKTAARRPWRGCISRGRGSTACCLRLRRLADGGWGMDAKGVGFRNRNPAGAPPPVRAFSAPGRRGAGRSR
ncbi:MAG: putative beta-hydroxyacid dehydrogenase, partial [Verrucomicrobiota bacterium]